MPAIMPDPSLSAPPGIPPLSSIAAPPSGAPALGSGNPILDEIDNAHASLNPPAKQAIEDAHGIIGLRPSDTAQATESAAPSLAPMGPTASPGLPPVGQSPLAPALSLGGQPGQTGAQHELSRLQTTGSGISQIHSPWARVPLQILDAIGGGLFPGIEQRLPGTAGHHDVLLAQQGKAVSQEEGERAAEDKSALEQAQAQNQEAIPALKQSAADLAASKEREIETGHRNTEDINRAKNQGVQDTAAAKEAGRAETAAANRKASLASHGYEENEKGEIVPLSYEKMSETQQAVHDLKSAQSEQAEATAALKKAQASNQPAMVALAQKRLDSASQAHQIASERLGLSEKQFEMRAHGTEGGEALPGSLVGDNGQPVGTAFQQNVRPTGTQRDAAGRANTMLDLDARIRKALQNPEIQKGTGPLAGRLSEIEGRLGTLPHDLSELRNDLVSYGAFQAGLHPVRGIGALQYFDKVMGGLGQKPEELVGKLDSNKATAQSVKKVGDVKATGSNAASGGPPTVTSQAEFDKLAPGTVYLEDGKKYTKPEAKK